MSLRNRVLVSAVALCAVLTSGCMQAVMGRNPAVFDHLTEIPDLRNSVPSSPYHQQTTSPVVVRQPSPTKPDPRPPSPDPLPLVGREASPKEIIQPLPDLPTTTSVARAAPEPPEEPIVQALRCYLLNRPGGATDALRLLQKYPQANQEMLLFALPLLERLTQVDLEKLSPEKVGELVEQVRQLENALRKHAPLSIDELRFCTSIDSYGQVEDHPPEFRGGSADQVGDRARVYIPLRNVVNSHSKAGYETWLTGKAQVRRYDPNALFDNKLVCDLDDIKPQRLVSPAPRHEYFLAYGFWIPKKLPPGKYQLWIQVKDITNQMTGDVDQRPKAFNVAEKTIIFEVKDPGLTVRGSAPSDDEDR